MSLEEKFKLCFVFLFDLFSWTKQNEVYCFSKEGNKWKEFTSLKPNFFSDTELLIDFQDFVVLQVLNSAHQQFLAKNYKLGHQKICRTILKKNKNLIIVTKSQWKKENEISDDKAVVLLKDEESIKNSVNNFFNN